MAERSWEEIARVPGAFSSSVGEDKAPVGAALAKQAELGQGQDSNVA